MPGIIGRVQVEIGLQRLNLHRVRHPELARVERHALLRPGPRVIVRIVPVGVGKPVGDFENVGRSIVRRVLVARQLGAHAQRVEPRGCRRAPVGRERHLFGGVRHKARRGRHRVHVADAWAGNPENHRHARGPGVGADVLHRRLDCKPLVGRLGRGQAVNRRGNHVVRLPRVGKHGPYVPVHDQAQPAVIVPGNLVDREVLARRYHRPRVRARRVRRDSVRPPHTKPEVAVRGPCPRSQVDKFPLREPGTRIRNGLKARTRS